MSETIENAPEAETNLYLGLDADRLHAEEVHSHFAIEEGHSAIRGSLHPVVLAGNLRSASLSTQPILCYPGIFGYGFWAADKRNRQTTALQTLCDSLGPFG